MNTTTTEAPARKQKSGQGEGKSKPVRLGEFEDNLPCPLTDKEMRERGMRLAELYSDQAEHEAHAKSVREELKAVEARIAEEATRLVSIIRNAAEPRPCKVERWADYERGIYYERRADTGELVKGTERPLRPEERQGVLRLDTTRAPPMPPSLDEQRSARQKELERQADALFAKGKE